MTTFIDLIFKGYSKNINYDFLDKFMISTEDINFMYPENITKISKEIILHVLESNNYVDLVISANYIELFEFHISNLFINISRNDKNIEILLFFDLKDSINYLYEWSILFKNK